VHTDVWYGNLRERDHVENLGVGGKIILKWSSSSGMVGMEWIDMAQDMNR
jgi:hypothetical protein